MKIIKRSLIIFLTYFSLINNKANAKNGISFVVVGDWANQSNMKRPKSVFDAIN